MSHNKDEDINNNGTNNINNEENLSNNETKLSSFAISFKAKDKASVSEKLQTEKLHTELSKSTTEFSINKSLDTTTHQPLKNISETSDEKANHKVFEEKYKENISSSNTESQTPSNELETAALKRKTMLRNREAAKKLDFPVYEFNNAPTNQTPDVKSKTTELAPAKVIANTNSVANNSTTANNINLKKTAAPVAKPVVPTKPIAPATVKVNQSKSVNNKPVQTRKTQSTKPKSNVNSNTAKTKVSVATDNNKVHKKVTKQPVTTNNSKSNIKRKKHSFLPNILVFAFCIIFIAGTCYVITNAKKFFSFLTNDSTNNKETTEETSVTTKATTKSTTSNTSVTTSNTSATTTITSETTQISQSETSLETTTQEATEPVSTTKNPVLTFNHSINNSKTTSDGFAFDIVLENYSNREAILSDSLKNVTITLYANQSITAIESEYYTFKKTGNNTYIATPNDVKIPAKQKLSATINVTTSGQVNHYGVSNYCYNWNN